MNEILRGTFATIFHRLPGRYDRLRAFLETAPPDVVREFATLVRNYDVALNHADQLRRQPWRVR